MYYNQRQSTLQSNVNLSILLSLTFCAIIYNAYRSIDETYSTRKGSVIMKYLNTVRQLIMKYKHGVILSYFFIYILWFTYLERTVTDVFHPIHSRLDDLIPFNEMFIIPYFLWFIYIFVVVTYLLLTSKQEFYKCCAYLFIGMTICLIVYTIWPNGHYLRVDLDSLGRSNIYIDML